MPPCPFDYRLWQQTMYIQFGQKWAKLHHGPLWCVASTGQSEMSSEACSLNKQDNMKVRITMGPLASLYTVDCHFVGFGEYSWDFRTNYTS